MTHDSSHATNSASEHSDVATILANLREEVRARRTTAANNDKHHAARSGLERQLQHCSEQLELTRVISAHWPLTGRTIGERIMALFNKLVRRYLRWYINPIVDQQNEWNDVATRTLRLLIDAHIELRDQLADVSRHIDKKKSLMAEQNTDDSGNKHIPDADVQDVEQAYESLLNRYELLNIPINELQTLVETLGNNEPEDSCPDIPLRSLIRQLALHQEVNAHWHLGGSNLIEKSVSTANKAVRFYLRWLINPIVEQQNSFNAAVTCAIPLVLAADADMRAELAEIRARLRKLTTSR